MRNAIAAIIVAAGLAWGAVALPPRGKADAPAKFARGGEVMSLLESRCVRCHEGKKSRGGLDLASREKLMEGGDNGAAIIPGKARESLLLKLVRHEMEPVMPRQGGKLSPADVELLAAWIDAGAVYERKLGQSEAWWSLQPVKKAAVPALGADKLPGWDRNPIDAFIAAKLKANGLTPSPAADPRVLVRRLYFDLHGLPPTPDDVDAFVKETQALGAPAAVEKLADRLLASPRYGERWARHWMDVIHFAETHGHDQDVPRDNAWPYRDYLIRSLNDDKPYGRFVEEQIAGDALYPADPQATVALGFLAAGPWDESSLKDIREDSIDRKAGQYLDRDDMLGTVGLAFLSTTIQCARCHDHKFDPVSQQEYYNLQAVFAGVDRADRSFEPDAQMRAKRLALTKLRTDLASPTLAAKLVTDPAHIATAAAWEKEQRSDGPAWRTLDPVTYTSAGGADIVKLPDSSLRFGGKKPERDTYTIETNGEAMSLTAVRLDVLADDALPQKGPGRQDNGNLHLSEFKVEWVSASDPKQRKPLAIARAMADFNQAGWEIDKAIDGVMPTAWGIHPAVGQNHSAIFVLKEPMPCSRDARLVFTLEQQHGGGHLIGRPKLSASSNLAPDLRSPLPPNIQATLTKTLPTRTPVEQAELVLFAVKQRADRDLAALPKPQMVYAAATEFATNGSFRPAGGCRPVHLLKRGDVKQPLNLATPGALSCVAELNSKFTLTNPADESQRRAALAKWVSDPKNPLTWRSIVNRVWHYHFGRGLLATPSDFGRMGGLPSHPELLDWLTASFMEDGGSLKKLHRRIVTSAAYQQASRHRDDAAKIDADNVLLWRMNVQRLDAESVRDAVLQIAGKIDLAMGGPSIKHFQQSPGSHRTPRVDYAAFNPDAPGAYRRSVYRFVFRTVPDPFMDALDCPDASQFAATRNVSLTALQALALLNDPFMVRMSEHVAKRLQGDVPSQVRQAYRLALGRDPTGDEAALLTTYAQRHGLANACRVLLNCNEFTFVP